MKVNYKQLYLGLNQQAKSLREKLNPVVDADKVNEIPENFNQIGWNVSIEKVELMISKMKQLVAVKGNRLTPQFYRSIYNRALIATGEADKLIESLAAETTDINYEVEANKLNGEIFQLQAKIVEMEAEKALAAEAAKALAAEAATKAAEAEAALLTTNVPKATETAGTGKTK